MSKGIVLFAFGEPAYYNMAFNMALSIKATSNLKVALVHDLDRRKSYPMPQDRFKVFDKMVPLKKKHTDAGQIKCHMYEYMQYDDNLYLDVDGCVLKDIEPLLDELAAEDGYFYTQVNGSGGKSEVIPYSIWAKNSDIWEFFELEEDAIQPAIQSSYMFIRKCAEAKPFFTAVAKNFNKGFPHEKIMLRWGGSVPDELIYSGTLAQFKLDASGGRHVFFGWKNKESVSEVFENFYALALYGGRNLVKLKYKEMYDRYMHKTCKKMGQPWIYKANAMLKKKHANG
ncbi:hypothetical protein DRO66_00280 [Candidatus Bathyarchaeota archaeon]|nr:MAG: hypothetical protein DRO66_00280 [Candidatus Bathyarchaeota archaeon]